MILRQGLQGAQWRQLSSHAAPPWDGALSLCTESGQETGSGLGLPGGQVHSSLLTQGQTPPGLSQRLWRVPQPSCVHLPSRERSKEGSTKNWGAHQWILVGYAWP